MAYDESIKKILDFNPSSVTDLLYDFEQIFNFSVPLIHSVVNGDNTYQPQGS